VNAPSVPAVRAPPARAGELGSGAADGSGVERVSAAGGAVAPRPMTEKQEPASGAWSKPQPSIRELTLAGVAAARANPALIAVRWIGDLVVAALVVGGTLLPPVALFGRGFAGRFAPLGEAFRARDPDALAVAVLDLSDAVTSAPGAVTAGLVGLFAVWTVALFVYCWVQGGFYGVLLAADRGSVAAFSGVLFGAEGRRLLWPYFWFVNLYATALLLMALITLLPLALVPAPPPGDPPLASLAVAAAVLPFAALAAAVLAVWYAVGRVEVARRVGVASASRRALAALLRRPGPVLALTLLASGVTLTLSGMAAPVGAALAALPGPASLAGVASLTAAQWLATAAVATAYAGALVRLMRLEFPRTPVRGAVA